MKAISLFGVFALAKIVILFDQNVAPSLLTPFAYLWQDALVALLFGMLEATTRKQPWLAITTYAALVVYVAINVPLTRALSSPLTWPMARAAGGALTDSIVHYLTWFNGGSMVLIATSGVFLPRLLRKLPPGSNRLAGITAAGLLALGGWSSGRIDSGGFERNAVVAFATSVMPRVDPTQEQMDWRSSSPWREEDTRQTDLKRFQGAAKGRNVVLIALESTGAQYLRPYGATEDPMPHLTRLAETALLFENVYAVYPESIKGLFSVLCSRYPAFDTDPAALGKVTTPSLAQLLGCAGYRTGLFHSGRFMYLGMQSVIERRGFDVLEDAGSISGNFNSSFGVDEPATVQRMLAWLDSLPHAKPFFLTYLPIAGHHPYETPASGPFHATDDASQYRNALHYADSAVGELWRGLEARNLASNTLFVVYGDHGEAFGQHAGNHGHTLFLYEENVRVPCLVVAPGLVTNQIRIPRLGSLIDLAPTVLDLLALTSPADYQGAPLLEPGSPMALFYTDYSLPLVGLRDGPWKFIHELGSARSKLFRLTDDPGERRNLAGEAIERVGFYRQRLERWSAAQKGLLHSASAAPTAPNPVPPR